jgi:hypothetical protein
MPRTKISIRRPNLKTASAHRRKTSNVSAKAKPKAARKGKSKPVRKDNSRAAVEGIKPRSDLSLLGSIDAQGLDQTPDEVFQEWLDNIANLPLQELPRLVYAAVRQDRIQHQWAIIHGGLKLILNA